MVSANTGWGIALRQSQGNSGGATFAPTRNTISDNTAWGNSTDLYDDGTGSEDTWAGNVCATKQGAAIPACSPLTVITNPSNQSAVAGTTASFSAAATYAGWLPSGATPNQTVQWQAGTNNGVTWTNVSGATSSTYSFTAAMADSGEQYRAVFTDSNGTATTTAATLTVATSSSGPAVTTQPSNQAVLDGENATFLAAASGTPTPAVQWQVSTDSGATWGNLVTMATSPVYSFTTGASDACKQYRAVFTNSLSTATTRAATLTVRELGGAHGPGRGRELSGVCQSRR
jgi:hypothetical protein